MRSPEAVPIREFLRRAGQRLFWRSMAEGAAIGLIVALMVALIGWPARGMPFATALVAVALTAAGVVLRLATTADQRHSAAHEVERAAPGARNLLITAAELVAVEPGQHPATSTQAAGYAERLVLDQAAQFVATLDLASLLPLRRAILLLLAAIGLWSAAVLRINAPAARRAAVVAAAAQMAVVDRIDVTVTPPAYAKQQSRSLHDPSRIEALEGSRLHLVVHARAGTVTVETLHGSQRLATDGSGVFTADISLDVDGYLAIEPSRSDGATGTRRLVGLSATPDQAPRVHVTAPGRDLQFPNGTRSLDLTVAADDDIGLAALTLRYTKVAGSGERFTFVDGDLPLTITRADAKRWTARATWRLASVGLEPGDMVVYRAVARDGRPGAPPVESDSWIVAITAPGGIAAAGFAIDPEQERYAVSQQMVILKTERLLAAKLALSPEAFADSAALIGAEQRRVRAEFVFMMGGEVADDQGEGASMTQLNEQAEADGESDLAAGRMVNAGRLALLRGIRHMSRASTKLTTRDVTTALGEERQALAEVEKAFSHSRILLRALTQHERLDLSRRLTGVLTEAASATRPRAEAVPNQAVLALRPLLADVAALAAPAALPPDAAIQANRLAEQALRINPSAPAQQQIAALLASASLSSSRGEEAAARRALDRAATAIATALRSNLQAAPGVAAGAELQRLMGELTDRLRHVPVRP